MDAVLLLALLVSGQTASQPPPAAPPAEKAPGGLPPVERIPPDAPAPPDAVGTPEPPAEEPAAEEKKPEEPAEPEAPAAGPERGLFMQAVQGTYLGSALDAHKISISGWLSGTFTGSSANDFNLPMIWNYRANQLLLHQNWLRIDKPVDTASTSATFGFRSDTLLPGSSDYRFTLSRGLADYQLTTRNGGPEVYGYDPVQFYVEGYFPNVLKGLDVKLGRFYSPYGVESIEATGTPFKSLPFTFTFNPFIHTGLYTKLKLDDTWTLNNGIVTGADVFIDPAATPTYIGGIGWAPPNGRTTATFSVVLTGGRFDEVENLHNPQIFDIVVTHKVTERLNYTFNALAGYTYGVPNLGYAKWYGIVNYLSYTVNQQLTANTRFEVFDDVDGQRSGFKSVYTNATVGLLYKPKPWLWLRPELRVDHNDARPFEGKPTLGTAAMDVMFRW
jgi:hypothetical protein